MLDVEQPGFSLPLVEKSKKEGGKRIAARLTEIGRGQAKEEWEGFLQDINPHISLRGIREAADVKIQEIRKSSQYADETDFLRLLELSFEHRLDYLERTQFLEEMKTSYAPWRRSLKILQEKLYPDLPLGFVNYFAAPMILSLKKSISAKAGGDGDGFSVVAYENEIAICLAAFLRQADSGELKAIKDKEGLSGLAKAAVDWHYYSQELPEVAVFQLRSPKEETVTALRAKDILAPEQKKEPSRLRKTLERLIPSVDSRRKALQAVLTGVLAANLLISSIGPIKQTETIKSAVSSPASEIIITMPAPEYQMALALAPVDIPPPVDIPLPVIPAIEEEKPHFFQDSQLEALYQQGCLGLFEADIDGDGQPEVKILDYPAADQTTPLCAEKLVLEEFGQEHPARERLHQFRLTDDEELTVAKQTPSACALHAYFMGISFLLNPRDENGLPVVMNPFLIGEKLKMTLPEYVAIAQQLSEEESMQLVYGSGIDEASQSGAINIAIQREKRGEFFEFLDRLGIKIAQRDLIQYPKVDEDGNVRLVETIFSENEWLELTRIYPTVSTTKSFFGRTMPSKEILLPPKEAVKAYSEYLHRNYLHLKTFRKEGAIFLGLQSDDAGVKHLYLLLGVKEIDGKKYFHVIEGRAGQPAQWGYYEGQLIRNQDGSLDIPLDQLYRWQPSFQVMVKK